MNVSKEHYLGLHVPKTLVHNSRCPFVQVSRCLSSSLSIQVMIWFDCTSFSLFICCSSTWCILFTLHSNCFSAIPLACPPFSLFFSRHFYSFPAILLAFLLFFYERVFMFIKIRNCIRVFFFLSVQFICISRVPVPTNELNYRETHQLCICIVQQQIIIRRRKFADK